MADRVDVGPLREAIESSDMSIAEIARRMAWFKPDTSRVRRVIGSTPHTSLNRDKSKTYRECARTIAYARAVELAHAADIDPVDVGL